MTTQSAIYTLFSSNTQTPWQLLQAKKILEYEAGEPYTKYTGLEGLLNSRLGAHH